jgi:protein-S-isoprenylcysteine O-methyltransferase Ste14
LSTGEHGSFLTRSRLRDTIFFLSIACALFQGVNDIRIVIAFSLLVLGTFIHFVTKGVLIRNKVLCREGIYSITRHPYYMANFLIDSGFCVLSGFPALFIAYPFLFFWSYGPTMRKEERDLRGWYPDSFPEYVFDTPQVFPDRGSMRNIGSLFDGFSFRRVTAKEMARIVRFYAMAVMILFAHTLSVHITPHLALSARPVTSVLLAFAVVLYLGSAVILSIGRTKVAKNEVVTLI